MIQKIFDDISKDDIQALIENEIAEGKKIEYKQEPPVSWFSVNWTNRHSI